MASKTPMIVIVKTISSNVKDRLLFLPLSASPHLRISASPHLRITGRVSRFKKSRQGKTQNIFIFSKTTLIFLLADFIYH
jgi:hypothetical protein